MKLYISAKYDKSFNEDVYCLSTKMLQMKSTHLFIASNLWDSIVIDIDENIPEGCLCNLELICKDIKVNIPDELTDKMLHLLVELYPSKSGALRKAYMFKKSIKEVLVDCLA